MEAHAPELYYFPNKMGLVVLLALEEVMGRNALHTVLQLARLPHLREHYPPNDFALAFPFTDLSRLLVALEELYGPRGGRGLALRAGRVCFKYGVQDFGGVLGFTDVAFRLLPLSLKVRLALEVLAQICNRYSDQRVLLGENDTAYLCIIERCGLCWERQTTQPVCTLAIGLLEESLYWVSGGKRFDIEELTCMATGAPNCTFQIHKRPLDFDMNDTGTRSSGRA